MRSAGGIYPRGISEGEREEMDNFTVKVLVYRKVY